MSNEAYRGGGTRYGMRVGEHGTLVEDPEQQRVIRRAARFRRMGLSLREISRQLEMRGVRLTAEGIRVVLDRLVEQDGPP
jgi:hypothetical protein